MSPTHFSKAQFRFAKNNVTFASSEMQKLCTAIELTIVIPDPQKIHPQRSPRWREIVSRINGLSPPRLVEYHA